MFLLVFCYKSKAVLKDLFIIIPFTSVAQKLKTNLQNKITTKNANLTMARPKIDEPKQRTSFALSKEAKRLLKATAQKTGMSQAVLLEIAIRALAKKEKVE